MSYPRTTQPGHFHAVQFYRDDDSLVTVVARFLAQGCVKGDPGIIIGTPEHRTAIEETLAVVHGVDVQKMKQAGDLLVLDARETLDMLMADGMPQPSVVEFVIGSLLDETTRAHPDRTIRAFGEMVDLLWKDGLTSAAVRLERLWNGLASGRRFKLLCGYSTRNLYKDATVGEITRQHSHLLAENGELATIN